MIVTPEFPEHRLQDPRRQAEWRVYQEIAGSQAPGRALYEMRAGLHAPQLDFGIWLQDVAHYGLQVKGGETATEGGEWRLHSANGPETIPGPLLPRHGPGPDHRGPGCRGPRHCPLGRR